jgi:tetratricopeptide (TPR) repeat protein
MLNVKLFLLSLSFVITNQGISFAQNKLQLPRPNPIPTQNKLPSLNTIPTPVICPIPNIPKLLAPPTFSIPSGRGLVALPIPSSRPSSLSFRLQAENFFSQGKLEEAQSKLSEAIKLSLDAKDNLEIAENYHLQSLIYKKNANKTGAKTALSNSVAAYKSALSTIPQEQQSNVYFRLGNLYENHNDYDDAVINYRKSLGITYEYHVQEKIKKLLLSKLRRPQEMIIVYQDALRKNPKNRNLTDDLIRLQTSLDREKQYIKDNLKNPKDLSLYLSWADLLIDREDREGAKEVFQKFVTNYNPKNNSSEKMMSLCNTTWAEELYNRGFPNLAIETYQKDLKLNPGSGVALVNMAKILQEQGKISQAIAAYRQAIQVDPQRYGSYRSVIQALENK